MKDQLQKIIRENLRYPDATNLQQRGIADRIEDACNRIITAAFQDVAPARSRRSIEDINIGKTYVDHKTSDRALDFKMPNLISIDRLKKLDRDLLYNFVIYDSGTKCIVDVFVLSIYELNWDHLKIQNLGVGQLQITNMADFIESPKSTMSPAQWKTRLQSEAVAFYAKLAMKTAAREKKWAQWAIPGDSLQISEH